MPQRIRLYLGRALLGLVLTAAAVWTADWLILRLKIAGDRAAFGSIDDHHWRNSDPIAPRRRHRGSQ